MPDSASQAESCGKALASLGQRSVSPLAIEFRVPGRPVAWQRAGLSTRSGRAIMFTKERSRAYQSVVREAAIPHLCEAYAPSPDSAWHLTIIVTVSRPKAHFKRDGSLRPDSPSTCRKKPDLSNTIKQIEDALNGVVWQDDSQIVEHHTQKLWGESDEVYVKILESRRDWRQ